MGPVTSGLGASLEKLVSFDNLRVLGILDLHPGRAPTVDLIRSVRPLPHDALKIPVARNAVKIAAASDDVIEIQQPTLDGGQHTEQDLLPIEQRQPRKVPTLPRRMAGSLPGPPRVAPNQDKAAPTSCRR